MNPSTPGLAVHHQLPEFIQTHVHSVGDAIQPSHPLLSPSPPAFNLSQHLGLFQWVSSSHQMAKVLEFHLQHQSFQWIFRTDFLWTGWISLQSKRLSRIFSNTTVQEHQFFWHSAFFISNTINNLHEIISHNHHNHITCALSILARFYRGRNWDLDYQYVQDHKTNNWQGWDLNTGNVSLRLASIKWGENWKHIMKRHKQKHNSYKCVIFIN